MRKFGAGQERQKLSKAVAGLQEAMQQRLSNAASCTAACRQLADMTYRNGDAQMLVGRAGLLEDIADAMEKHVKVAELQEAACRALGAIGAEPLNVNKACALLPAVRAAMKAHPSVASVQEAACRAVDVLTAQPKARAAVSSTRLLASIQSAMKLHRRVASLQEAACSAISNSVLDCVATQEQAARLGLTEDIAAAAAAHPTAPKVVDRSRTALERLSAAPPAAGGATSSPPSSRNDEAGDGDESEDESQEEDEEDADT